MVRLGKSASKLKDAGTGRSTRSGQHSVVLTGLKPDTTYRLRVDSVDPASNEVLGKVVTFATPEWGVADQMTASFKRGTLKDAATIDEADVGSITLSGSRTTARKGTFVSGVLDAQAMVDWDRALWHAQVPSGSRLVVSVRTGSMLKPDKTWSELAHRFQRGTDHWQLALHSVQAQDDQPCRDSVAGSLRHRIQQRRCPIGTAA